MTAAETAPTMASDGLVGSEEGLEDGCRYGIEEGFEDGPLIGVELDDLVGYK
jgi:hypothetical protein